MTSLPRVRGFDWNNFAIRAASGGVLAAAALWAVWVFDWGPLWRAPFLILIAVAGALLSFEWAAMASPKTQAPVAAATAIAVVAVILLAFVGRFGLAWACLAIGVLAAGLLARLAGGKPLDAAYGVLYIAPAGMVIAWLRESHQGRGWVLMLFAAAWAADISAFVVGNALKGPKLWPRFSPNKTWTGFVGGLTGAMIACIGVAAAFMRLSLVGAAVIGLLGGLATMAGDLWESMLKRRYGVKDSGDLIPGHGGLLDRVDGLMFAVMVFAFARLVDRFGWAH